MSYRVSRAQHVTEELDLSDKSGNVIQTLQIDIDVYRIALDITRAYNDVIRAEAGLKTSGCALQGDLIEQYGDAVISLLSLLFGKDNASVLLKYFDGQYTEMVTQLLPFIQEVIMPSVKRTIAEKRKGLARQYMANKRV